MASRLIIDGNSVYEIDEDCMKKKQGRPMKPQPGPRRSYQQPKRMDAEQKEGGQPL